MRFLGIGEYCDLADLYLRLAREGHDVRVHVSAPESRETLSGLIDHTPDWREELAWIKDAKTSGIILFEGANAGAEQDALRKTGYHVIGGSAFGDRLEGDRAFGQKILNSVGVPTAPTRAFLSYQDGIEYIRETPKRYVYKPNGDIATSIDTYVGRLDDGADVIDILQAQAARSEDKNPPDYILMSHLDGVEVGVGAYFNGNEFLHPACIDFEHKRFFTGNMGELTGEMGTVVSYRGAERLFEATLAKVGPLLAESNYCGYINLNTIVNGEGIWPLEFTSRFGYPGFAILDPLQEDGWASLFGSLAGKKENTFPTHDGYCVGVVLTVPPFPYISTVPPAPKKLRVLFREPLSDTELGRIHFNEVALEQGRLVTSGVLGQVMVITARGETVPQAQRSVYELLAKVAVPNMRFRTDIGDRFVFHDEALLKKWGVLP